MGQNIDGKILNLESQKYALEETSTNAQMVKAMKQGADTMKNQMKNMDIENIDEITENVQEAMDQQAEINDALANPMGDLMDDDDLDAELQALEDDEAMNLDHELAEISISTPAEQTKQK